MPAIFVSIIMPVFQEGQFIAQSLGAVLAQDYPKDFMEILVVDGMSSDETREIVRNFQKQHSNVRLLDNQKKIVAPGLNLGVREAKGEIIIRLDGHTIIEKDYISQCVACLQSSRADNVGGPMHAEGKDFISESIALAVSSPFGVGGARFHYSEKEEWVDTVYLGAWHREIFDRIGLFDEELVRNQDDEFNYRLRKAGGKILLSPKIKSCYYSRSSLASLWKQYFQYGYWKVRVLQKHPKQMQWRQFVPPVFVAACLTEIALSQKALLAMTMMGYLAANLTTSLWLAVKKGWQYLFLLSFVFATLHFSYGLGFLWGLARFIRRWNVKI